LESLPTLLITCHQALSVAAHPTVIMLSLVNDTAAVSPSSSAESSAESLLMSIADSFNALPPAPDMHTASPSNNPVLLTCNTHTVNFSLDDSDSDLLNDPCPFVPCSMLMNTPAECIHAEPKHIPLLSPGKVLPMVIWQWEMACEDFFSANKKLEEGDRIAAISPGLKDMCARDWVATHHAELIVLPFASFIKDVYKEFLSNGWDDELHAHICNSCLKPSDSFTKWVNDIHHLNIILHGTDYHFSEDALHFQLDSLLDVDLHTHCKNRKIKELVNSAVNSAGEQTREARLAKWIMETWKLAEEHSHDTKCYLEASKDFQCAPKHQALASNSHGANTASTKPYSALTATSVPRTKPPRLTDNEQVLLHKHQDCMKCRCGYQTHHASDCPFDFLNPHNYKELTEDVLLSHK
jgi:hypothetical protein